MRKKIFWDVAALGWAVAATVVGAVGWAATATAADCGDGVKACQCGDTVVANTTLTSNIGGCQKTGLFVVGSSIVLNCVGHTLTGAPTAHHRGDPREATWATSAAKARPSCARPAPPPSI